MIEDGVNDALAPRRAKLSITMSTTTDIAKSSAGVALLATKLRGIVDVMNVSRRIYQKALT